MRIKFRICLLVLKFFCCYSFAQNSKQECRIYISYAKNIRDTVLVTGFYIVTPKETKKLYYDESDSKNYHVEYKQHIDEIEMKRQFPICRRKTKSHYVYSSSSIIAEEKPVLKDSNKSFNRKLLGTNQEYQVNPFPISTKDNVIRIYDFKHYKPDSTLNIGLTLKLDFCIDSLLCTNDPYNYNEKCPKTGLMIHDQLVAVTTYYIRYKYNFMRGIERYIVFLFPGQSTETIAKYKKELFKQSLYKKS